MPCRSVIILALALGSPAAPAQDSAEAGLGEARADHDAATEAARAKFLESLRSREQAAQKAGSLKGVERIRGEIEALEAGEPVLPGSAPAAASTYQREVKRARNKLIEAHRQAIKGFTREDRLDDAQQADAALQQLLSQEDGGRGRDPAAPGFAAAPPIDPSGRPANFRARLMPRYAVRSDHQGWHVRATDRGARNRRFQGRIAVIGGRIASLQPVPDDGGRDDDTVTWDRDRTSLAFEIIPRGSEDGFDFTVAGKDPMVRFEFLLDGKPDGFQTGVGKAGTHPGGTNFTLSAPKAPNKP